MDKVEYREIIRSIKNKYLSRDYEGVIEEADQLEHERIRENSILEMIAKSYEILGRYDLARDTLLIAYKRTPTGKRIAYNLSMLSIKLEDLDSAVMFYEDFCKMAPKDNQRLLLKYEIGKAGGVPVKNLARVLENYNSREMDEKWEYELARLYHEMGDDEKCAAACDQIILWYANGEYEKKALELKNMHKALSPAQQARYEEIMADVLADVNGAVTPEEEAELEQILEIQSVDPGAQETAEESADSVVSTQEPSKEPTEKIEETPKDDVIQKTEAQIPVSPLAASVTKPELAPKEKELDDTLAAPRSKPQKQKVLSVIGGSDNPVASVFAGIQLKERPSLYEEEEVPEEAPAAEEPEEGVTDPEAFAAEVEAGIAETVSAVRAEEEIERWATQPLPEIEYETEHLDPQTYVEENAQENEDGIEGQLSLSAMFAAFQNQSAEDREEMNRIGEDRAAQILAEVTESHDSSALEEFEKEEDGQNVVEEVIEPEVPLLNREDIIEPIDDGGVDLGERTAEFAFEKEGEDPEPEITHSKELSVDATQYIPVDQIAAQLAAAAREEEGADEEDHVAPSVIGETAVYAEIDPGSAAGRVSVGSAADEEKLNTEEIEYDHQEENLENTEIPETDQAEAETSYEDNRRAEDFEPGRELTEAEKAIIAFEAARMLQGEPEEEAKDAALDMEELMGDLPVPEDAPKAGDDNEADEDSLAEAAEPETDNVMETADESAEEEIPDERTAAEEIAEETATATEEAAEVMMDTVPASSSVSADIDALFAVMNAPEEEPDKEPKDALDEEIITATDGVDTMESETAVSDDAQAQEDGRNTFFTSPSKRAMEDAVLNMDNMLLRSSASRKPRPSKPDRKTQSAARAEQAEAARKARKAERQAEAARKAREAEQAEAIRKARLAEQEAQAARRELEAERAQLEQTEPDTFAEEAVLYEEQEQKPRRNVLGSFFRKRRAPRNKEQELLPDDDTQQNLKEAIAQAIRESQEAEESQQEVYTVLQEELIEGSGASEETMEELAEVPEASAEVQEEHAEVPEASAELQEESAKLSEESAEPQENTLEQPDISILEDKELEDILKASFRASEPEPEVMASAMEPAREEEHTETLQDSAEGFSEVSRKVFNEVDRTESNLAETSSTGVKESLHATFEGEEDWVTLANEEIAANDLEEQRQKQLEEEKRQRQAEIEERQRAQQEEKAEANRYKEAIKQQKALARAEAKKQKAQAKLERAETSNEVKRQKAEAKRMRVEARRRETEARKQQIMSARPYQQDQELGDFDLDEILHASIKPEKTSRTSRALRPAKTSGRKGTALSQESLDDILNASIRPDSAVKTEPLNQPSLDEILNAAIKADTERMAASGKGESLDDILGSITRKDDALAKEKTELAESLDEILNIAVKTESDSKVLPEQATEDLKELLAASEEMLKETSKETPIEAPKEPQSVTGDLNMTKESLGDLLKASPKPAEIRNVPMTEEAIDDLLNSTIKIDRDAINDALRKEEDRQMSFDDLFGGSYRPQVQAKPENTLENPLGKLSLNKHYQLNREQRRELGEFLMIDGMEEAICSTIEKLVTRKKSGDETGGHLIVTGDAKTGKTYLTIELLKAVNQEVGHGNPRVAKVQAQAINGKNVKKVLSKVSDSDLIIENIGKLEDDTIRELITAVRESNAPTMVILEGNELAADTLIQNFPDIGKIFKTRINIGELTLTQWGDVALQYARGQGYSIDGVALLALHARIDAINTPDIRLGYAQVRKIVDESIEKTERKNSGRLFSAFSKKSEDDLIPLTEESFQ